ncbi:RDD family protein [Ferruginibacter profundus]
MIENSFKKYQTFSQRLGAAIIDAILFLPVMYIGSKVFGPDEDKSILWLIILNGLYYAYSITGHHKYGQTIGKRLTFVKVVQSEDESKLLSPAQAFKRDLLGILLVLVEFCIIVSGSADTEYGDIVLGLSSFTWLIAEMLTMLFNNKRRSVHDYIANSVCIDITKPTAWEKKSGV